MKMKTDQLALSEFLNFGFILGNRTLSPDHKLNEINLRYEIENRKSSWKNVYRALEESTLKICSEAKHPILMLSGGLDSRIIAGIISKHSLDIPTLTLTYKDEEDLIARKVCSVLKLEHYVILVKPEEKDLTQMKKIVRSTCGIIPVHWFLNDLVASQKIKSLKISHAIYGIWLTELWNREYSCDYNSASMFCEKMAYSMNVLKPEYFTASMRNLFEYCIEKPLKTLYYETLIKSYTRGFLALKRIGIESLFPSLDERFLTETFALPSELRKNKTVNHLILKHEFPQLHKIRDVSLRLPRVTPKKIQLIYNRFHGFMMNKMNFSRGVKDIPHAFKNNFQLTNRLKKPLICKRSVLKDLVNQFFKTGKHFNLITRLITYSLFTEIEQR